jgi:hypothetical protein
MVFDTEAKDIADNFHTEGRISLNRGNPKKAVENYKRSLEMLI